MERSNAGQMALSHRLTQRQTHVLEAAALDSMMMTDSDPDVSAVCSGHVTESAPSS